MARVSKEYKNLNCKIDKEVSDKLEKFIEDTKMSKLLLFQVRDNPASERYVRNKIKDMDEVGIAHRLIDIMISMCKKGVLHT